VTAPDNTQGYVLTPPAQASLSVAGMAERFPVHRVYCVGRNYAAHAVEMGHDPDKEPPFFFQKNPDNLIADASDLDMTRRDLQGEMKKLGRPWEIGKAFEMSAPAGPIQPVAQVGHPADGEIWLKINEELKQSGNLNQMIWKTPEMISILSSLFTLQPGDVILTGTPAGVGPVHRGDRLHGHVAGVGDLHITVS